MSSVERWKGTKWRARYRTPDGASRSKVFDRKVDAERFLTSMEHSKMTGAFIDPTASGKVTVGEMVDRLLETKGDPKTREWYQTMAAHTLRRWQSVPITSVAFLDVQDWVHDLERQVGPDTVRGAYRALHEAIKMATRARYLAVDPCDGVRLPKVDRREMLFLNAEQVNALADRLDATWPGRAWGLLVQFTAYTGCRAGEVGALRVHHLDLLRRRVNVKVARKAYGEDGPTKTGASRWVDLPRQLCDELAAHIAAQGLDRESRVWTGDRGGALDHRWFYRQRFSPVVEEMTERGELPASTKVDRNGTERVYRLRFHDLRHTCVALLIAQGAQQYEVMEHLGHTKISTTIDTYGHLFPKVRERIREALERTWDEAAAGVG